MCVDDGQHLQTIFQAGFIDHLGGSSRIMLHIAEISCTLAALNFFQTRDTNTRDGARGATSLWLMKTNDTQPNMGRKSGERGQKAEDTSQAHRPSAMIKTRFSRRRMEPRGALFISVSPPEKLPIPA